MWTVEKPPVSPLLFSFPVLFFFFNLHVEVAIVTQRWNKLPVCFLWLIAASFGSLAYFRCVDLHYSPFHGDDYNLCGTVSVFLSNILMSTCQKYFVMHFQLDKLTFQDSTKKWWVCFVTELTSACYLHHTAQLLSNTIFLWDKYYKSSHPAVKIIFSELATLKVTAHHQMYWQMVVFYLSATAWLAEWVSYLDIHFNPKNLKTSFPFAEAFRHFTSKALAFNTYSIVSLV